jgi:hypothetical protein
LPDRDIAAAAGYWLRPSFAAKIAVALRSELLARGRIAEIFTISDCLVPISLVISVVSQQSALSLS